MRNSARLAATDPVTQALIRAMADHFGASPPSHIGVAVSGGSDSLAALHLLHECAQQSATRISAVTVDHGLRPASASEAAEVKSICAGLGLDHDILNWTGWSGDGNLQNEARLARYRLMTDWAKAKALDVIVLGHTQDDQAETVLMRLARGAGVDGLTAMTPDRCADGITWARPLLGRRRAELRAYLRARGVAWADDPGNDDTAYDRIKARTALKALEPLGITVPQLAQVARNMAQARTALDQQTANAARAVLRVDAGAVQADWSAFQAMPVEIQRRLLSGILRWISGSGYAPRGAALTEALETLAQGSTTTLQGCHMLRRRGTLWMFRELEAVRDLAAPVPARWDGRWTVRAAATGASDGVVRVLGETGLRQCPNWRELGHPRALFCSLPAVWQGEKLIAAPLVMRSDIWRFDGPGGLDELIGLLLSH